MNNAILDVRNLKTYFFTRRGVVKAVDGMSLGLRKGECLCLVGESGCGKTATALSILRLIDMPPGRIMDGQIMYHDEDLLHCSDERLRQIRVLEIIKASLSFDKIETVWLGENVTSDIVYDLHIQDIHSEIDAVNIIKKLLQDKGIIFKPW